MMLLNTWENHSVIKQTRTQKACHQQLKSSQCAAHDILCPLGHHLRTQFFLHSISHQPQHFESMLFNISYMLKPKPTDPAPRSQENYCVVQDAKTTPLPEDRALRGSAGVSTPPQPLQNTDWCTRLRY